MSVLVPLQIGVVFNRSRAARCDATVLVPLQIGVVFNHLCGLYHLMVVLVPLQIGVVFNKLQVRANLFSVFSSPYKSG